MSNQIAKSRDDAFHKQAGRCYYCNSPMWLNDRKYFALKYAVAKSAVARFQCTAEHLTPKCNGGSNSKSNIVAACFFCNHTRHRRKIPLIPSKYRAEIQKRLKQGKWHPKELHRVVFLST